MRPHEPGGESGEQAPLPIIYRVVRRSIDKHGNALLNHEIEVETYWTNLGENAETIIALYSLYSGVALWSRRALRTRCSGVTLWPDRTCDALHARIAPETQGVYGAPQGAA